MHRLGLDPEHVTSQRVKLENGRRPLSRHSLLAHLALARPATEPRATSSYRSLGWVGVKRTASSPDVCLVRVIGMVAVCKKWKFCCEFDYDFSENNGDLSLRFSVSVSMAAFFGPHEPSCHSPKTEYSFRPAVAASSVQSFNILPTLNEHFSDPAPFFTLHCFILPREFPGITSTFTVEVDNAVSVRSLIGFPKGKKSF